MRRSYIVRRVPTPYELHKAQERAETRRIIRDGVIAALLLFGTVAAILAAGAVPVRGASGGSAFATTLCDMRPHPTLEWSVENRGTDPVHAVLYIDGFRSRSMTVAPGTAQFGFKRYEHRHWVMIAVDNVIQLNSRIVPCRP